METPVPYGMGVFCEIGKLCPGYRKWSENGR